MADYEKTRLRICDLQEVINSEPRLRDTLAEIQAEYDPAFAHVTALRGKLDEIEAKLIAAAEAREELVRIKTGGQSPVSPTLEPPAPDAESKPADDPPAPPQTE